MLREFFCKSLGECHEASLREGYEGIVGSFADELGLETAMDDATTQCCCGIPSGPRKPQTKHLPIVSGPPVAPILWVTTSLIFSFCCSCWMLLRWSSRLILYFNIRVPGLRIGSRQSVWVNSCLRLFLWSSAGRAHHSAWTIYARKEEVSNALLPFAGQGEPTAPSTRQASAAFRSVVLGSAETHTSNFHTICKRLIWKAFLFNIKQVRKKFHQLISAAPDFHRGCGSNWSSAVWRPP